MSASIPYHAVRQPIRRPVRLLFRILAGLICVAFVFAAFGTVFMAWRGVHGVSVGDALMLPLTAWFMRLMYHVVFRGTTPDDGEFWPLASRKVWNFYLLLLLAYGIFTP
jgi:hypothetical protein